MKLYAATDGQITRFDQVVDPTTPAVPAETAETLSFDGDTNAALVADLQQNLALYRLVSGVLRRAGVVVTINRDRETLRSQVLTTAQTTVGLAIGSLTAVQVRSLLAILLHKEGALDKDGRIRPLGEWVR